MEDLMCWEIDYKLFAEQQKAQKAHQEARIRQEQRAEIIARLLDEANEQGGQTAEEASRKEAAPAK
jgi:hypothetical protein